MTTTDTEQAAPGGITVPELRLNDPAPGVATTEELAQVVDAKGEAELLMSRG